jgi:hypothetical protein
LGGDSPASSAAIGPCPSADAAHQGGEAAPSCRLCLIACNSRKFTQPHACTLLPIPAGGGVSGDR